MDQPKQATLPPATYVNFLAVGQQQTEFFLTFGQIAQQREGGAHLVSSLVTSPAHAKSMLNALEEAVNRYEKRFGEIPEVQPPTPTPVRAPQNGGADAAPEAPSKNS
jgi:hypothetical protein